MKKLLFTLLVMLLALPSFARDFTFEYEGQTLTYTVLSEEEKTVETKIGEYPYPGNNVSGVLTIPSIITDGTNEYAVTSIGEGAFLGCWGLKEVIIPNSVTTIGGYAFKSCNGLTEVTIPNSVTSIGNYAFQGCSSLKEVIIPNSVTTIGSYAFSSCSDLRKSAYPNNLTNPFDYCIAISYNPDGAIIEDHFIYGPDKAEILYAPLTLQGEYAIPESVTSIGDYTFLCCTGLTEVPIPNSVTSIGSYAFSECTGLTEVTIPNSVISIGDYAFLGCNGLTGVTLPNLVTSIGEGAFVGCSGLKEMIIPNSVTNIGVGAFFGCSDLTEVTIPSSVTSIGDEAFYSCGLKEVIIPNSVTSIGSHAFTNCNLRKSAYPNNLKNPFGIGIAIAYNPDGAIIEEHFVYGPDKAEIRFAPYTLQGEYTIPESVTSIGNNAFKGCTGLTEVILPSSVTSIGVGAFSYCCGLTKVTLPNSVTFIGVGAFSYCSGLTKVTLTNSVTFIGDSAFQGCTGLTEVTLPNSVASIGDYAFQGCIGLTEVIFPPSVETIGISAFAGNTSLSSIVIGHSVKSIGKSAFCNCPAETVYITVQTPPTAPDNTFSNYSGKLYVQDEGMVEAYKKASTCWRHFSSYDVMIEPTEIIYDGPSEIEGKPGDTFELKATLQPENVTLPQVFWRSTNPAIATVNNDGLVTLHAAPVEVAMYAESENGESDGCMIIAESLYTNGPVVEITVRNRGTTEIEDVIIDNPGNGATIDYSQPYEVYDLNGLKIGTAIEGLVQGIYIIRQDNVVKKIAIK